MKKRKRRKSRNRTPEQKERLAKKIIEYYFSNPDANGMKFMAEKFKITEAFIRKTLSDELDRRFKSARRVLNY